MDGRVSAPHEHAGRAVESVIPASAPPRSSRKESSSGSSGRFPVRKEHPMESGLGTFSKTLSARPDHPVWLAANMRTRIRGGEAFSSTAGPLASKSTIASSSLSTTRSGTRALA